MRRQIWAGELTSTSARGDGSANGWHLELTGVLDRDNDRRVVLQVPAQELAALLRGTIRINAGHVGRNSAFEHSAWRTLRTLVERYVELQYPPDDVAAALTDREAHSRSEEARGKAEQVITLLMDTGLWDVIVTLTGGPKS